MIKVGEFEFTWPEQKVEYLEYVALIAEINVMLQEIGSVEADLDQHVWTTLDAKRCVFQEKKEIVAKIKKVLTDELAVFQGSHKIKGWERQEKYFTDLLCNMPKGWQQNVKQHINDFLAWLDLNSTQNPLPDLKEWKKIFQGHLLGLVRAIPKIAS